MLRQKRTGFYSLIQFCPDKSRQEKANVGVVLFVPDLKFLEASTAKDFRRVRRFFGDKVFDKERFKTAIDALVTRLHEDWKSFTRKEDFDRFAVTRANDIVLTLPRSVVVTDPAVDLVNLAEELVVGAVPRPSQKAEKPTFAKLDDIFREPKVAPRIRFDWKVTIPILETEFKVHYAYQNGTVNLVRPEVFKGIPRAEKIVVEGDLLQKHPDRRNRKRKLIVVPEFEGPDFDPSLVERIENLLREYSIRVLKPEDLGAFAKEVEHEAHLPVVD